MGLRIDPVYVPTSLVLLFRQMLTSCPATYSNLENHPRLIRARESATWRTKKAAVPHIALDPKTGLPIVTPPSSNPNTKSAPHSRSTKPSFDDDSSGSDTETEATHRQTIARPKNETAEEKKARKAAVKAERQARRVEKKATKEQFDAEMKNAKRRLTTKDFGRSTSRSTLLRFGRNLAIA